MYLLLTFPVPVSFPSGSHELSFRHFAHFRGGCLCLPFRFLESVLSLSPRAPQILHFASGRFLFS